MLKYANYKTIYGTYVIGTNTCMNNEIIGEKVDGWYIQNIINDMWLLQIFKNDVKKVCKDFQNDFDLAF